MTDGQTVEVSVGDLALVLALASIGRKHDEAVPLIGGAARYSGAKRAHNRLQTQVEATR